MLARRLSTSAGPVVAAGTLLAAWLLGVSSGGLLHARSLDPTAWSTAEAPGQPVSIRYPPEWDLQVMPRSQVGDGGTQVLLSNVPLELRRPDLGPGAGATAAELEALTEGFVLVSLTAEPEPGTPVGYDRRAPIRFEDLRPMPSTGYGAPPGRHLVFASRGTTYRLSVWLGPDASPRDREIVRRIVSSIDVLSRPAVSPS
jgi:hypothetical protein